MRNKNWVALLLSSSMLLSFSFGQDSMTLKGTGKTAWSGGYTEMTFKKSQPLAVSAGFISKHYSAYSDADSQKWPFILSDLADVDSFIGPKYDSKGRITSFSNLLISSQEETKYFIPVKDRPADKEGYNINTSVAITKIDAHSWDVRAQGFDSTIRVVIDGRIMLSEFDRVAVIQKTGDEFTVSNGIPDNSGKLALLLSWRMKRGTLGGVPNITLFDNAIVGTWLYPWLHVPQIDRWDEHEIVGYQCSIPKFQSVDAIKASYPGPTTPEIDLMNYLILLTQRTNIGGGDGRVIKFTGIEPIFLSILMYDAIVR